MAPPPQTLPGLPPRGARSAAARLTAAARAALFTSGALPWLLPLGQRYLPLGRAGVALDMLFAPMCHRLPERTLSLAGVPMPLCSRCAGISAGVALGVLFQRPRLPLARARKAIGATLALMALDVVTYGAGLRPVFHPTRVLSGLLFGYALALACLSALRGELREA